MMTFIIDIYMTLSEDTKNEDKEKADEMLDEQNQENNVEMARIPEPGNVVKNERPQLRRRGHDSELFTSS